MYAIRSYYDIGYDPDGFDREETAGSNQEDVYGFVREDSFYACKVFHAAFAIIVPAQDCCKSEEDQTYA